MAHDPPPRRQTRRAPEATATTRRQRSTRARPGAGRTETSSAHAAGGQYRDIIELAPDALLAVDSDGRITLVNQQTERMFGYAREELLGQPIETLIPERSRAGHRRLRAGYMAEPHTRPMGMDLPLFGRRRDGSEFPVEIGLSPLQAGSEFAVAAIVRDITERRRIEAERAAAEAANQELRKLQTITESGLHTGVLQVEMDDLLPALLARVRQVMAVDNAALLLAAPGEETLTLTLAQGAEERLTGQVRIPFGEGVAGRIAATRAPLIVDDLRTVEVVNPLLHEKFRSLAGAPLLIDTRLIGVLHVASVTARRFTDTDIRLLQLVAQRVASLIEQARLYAEEQTSRREAEMARVNAEAARELSQRLDEFVSVASHDIRTPVAVIRGNIQQAQREFDQLLANEAFDMAHDDVRAVRESLTEAGAGADRLTRLVDMLFDIVRARNGKLELQMALCDLAEIVSATVEAQRIATPSRAIQLELPEERPVLVHADADRLGQVLNNYLSNAIKYSPDISVITTRLEVYGNKAIVSVQDEGPGLPWTEQSRVWEMFHRAPGINVQSATAKAASLGLGLHVCKQIIELHHGQVGVESVEGQGSTFWFSLTLFANAQA
ncbi:MAG TPA: PAS domain-containing sensor histidine kinase [Ktedonobacterales bacterium]